MKKKLALAQYLDLDVFTYNTKNGETLVYVGMTQEEFDQKEEGFLIAYDTREEVDEELRELIGDFNLLDDEIIETEYDDSRFEYGNEEYLVCTDSEADTEWDNYMDNYIAECVLHELPENYREYFDSEKFKNDCSFDGRGHSLASYDGAENEETVHTYDGAETFYIYRTN